MTKRTVAPALKLPERRASDTIWTRNWLGIVALAGSIIWQAWVGSTWVYDRQAVERELLSRIVKVESEQLHAKDVFVTQETFNLTMKNIEYRLLSIDTNVTRLSAAPK